MLWRSLLHLCLCFAKKIKGKKKRKTFRKWPFTPQLHPRWERSLPGTERAVPSKGHFVLGFCYWKDSHHRAFNDALTLQNPSSEITEANFFCLHSEQNCLQHGWFWSTDPCLLGSRPKSTNLFTKASAQLWNDNFQALQAWVIFDLMI